MEDQKTKEDQIKALKALFSSGLEYQKKESEEMFATMKKIKDQMSSYAEKLDSPYLKITGVRFNGLHIKKAKEILQPFEEYNPVKVIFLCQIIPDGTYSNIKHTLICHVAFVLTNYFGLKLAEFTWNEENNNDPKAQVLTLDQYDRDYLFFI